MKKIFFTIFFAFMFDSAAFAKDKQIKRIPLTILQFNGSHKCPIVHDEALVQILNEYAYFHPGYKEVVKKVEIAFKRAKLRFETTKEQLKTLLHKKDQDFLKASKRLENRWEDKKESQEYERIEKAHRRFEFEYAKKYNANVEQLERDKDMRRKQLLRVGLSVMKDSIVVLKDWLSSAAYIRSVLTARAKKGVRYFYLMHCAPSASTHILTLYFAEMIGTNKWRPLTPKRAFYFGEKVLHKIDLEKFVHRRILAYVIDKKIYKKYVLLIMNERKVSLKNPSTERGGGDRTDGNFAYFRSLYYKKYRMRLFSTLLITVFATRTAEFARKGKSKPLKYAADSRLLSRLLRDQTDFNLTIVSDVMTIGDLFSPRLTFGIHGLLGLDLDLANLHLHFGMGLGENFARKGLVLTPFVGTKNIIGHLSAIEFDFYTRLYVSLRLLSSRLKETSFALTAGFGAGFDPAGFWGVHSSFKFTIRCLVGPLLKYKNGPFDAGLWLAMHAGLSWRF